ncbi:MAG: LEA type 2 family protein [Fluviicola sp.]|jgi:LEA14-like dessication related protein
MKSLVQLGVLIISILLVSSCKLEDIDIDEPDNFNLKKYSSNQVEASFDVTVDNPSGMNFKLKRTNIAVFTGDKKLGTIFLSDKIKVKRKSENTYTVPVRIDLIDGAMRTIMLEGATGKIPLHFLGSVKVGTFIFSKKIKVDETKEIKVGDINIR